MKGKYQISYIKLGSVAAFSVSACLSVLALTLMHCATTKLLFNPRFNYVSCSRPGQTLRRYHSQVV